MANECNAVSQVSVVSVKTTATRPDAREQTVQCNEGEEDRGCAEDVMNRL